MKVLQSPVVEGDPGSAHLLALTLAPIYIRNDLFKFLLSGAWRRPEEVKLGTWKVKG